MASSIKQVDLSDPCIFALVQSTENPTFIIDYEITPTQSTQSTQSTYPIISTEIDMETNKEITTKQQNLLRNIFLIGLLILIIYIICVIVQDNKKNKKRYFRSPVSTDFYMYKK